MCYTGLNLPHPFPLLASLPFLSSSHGARGDTPIGCSRLNHWLWHSSLGFARFQQRLFGGDVGISQHSWRAFLSCWVTPSKKEEGDGGYFVHNKLFLVCFSYCYRYGTGRKFKNRKQTTYSAVMLTLLFSSHHHVNFKNVSPWLWLFDTTVFYIYLHTCQDILFLDD